MAQRKSSWQNLKKYKGRHSPPPLPPSYILGLINTPPTCSVCKVHFGASCIIYLSAQCKLGSWLLKQYGGLVDWIRVSYPFIAIIQFHRLWNVTAGTHLYTWVERGTVRVKCLAQEHNTMSPARAQTRTAWSGDKCTNHEATAPPNYLPIFGPDRFEEGQCIQPNYR